MLRHNCTLAKTSPLSAVFVSLQRAPGAPATYTQCFCGVESDDPDEFGEAVCNFECAGDPSQTCGGFNAISVYTFGTDGPPPTPAPVTPEFLGCWADFKSNRLMTLVVEATAAMTIEVRSLFPSWAVRNK